MNPPPPNCSDLKLGTVVVLNTLLKPIVFRFKIFNKALVAQGPFRLLAPADKTDYYLL